MKSLLQSLRRKQAYGTFGDHEEARRTDDALPDEIMNDKSPATDDLAKPGAAFSEIQPASATDQRMQGLLDTGGDVQDSTHDCATASKRVWFWKKPRSTKAVGQEPPLAKPVVMPDEALASRDAAASPVLKTGSLCTRMTLVSSGSGAAGEGPLPTKKAAKVAPYSVHAAAWRGEADEIQRLLAVRTSRLRKDKAGLAPVHYAAWQGHVDALAVLLEAGSSVDAQDAEGLTPLHYAAWMGQLEAASLLMDRGAAINADVKMKRAWPITPLAFAVKMGHMDMVQLLLARGASLNGPTPAAGSALHEAAWAGRTAVVELMMDCNAHHDRVTPKSLYRPLHLAAMAGHTAVIRVLLGRGAEVDSRAKNGRTPLHYAASKGHLGAARALMEAGADLEARDKDGHAPLHLAAEQGQVEVAIMLLQQGADHTARTVSGAQPVTFARDRDINKLLLALRWYGKPSVLAPLQLHMPDNGAADVVPAGLAAIRAPRVAESGDTDSPMRRLASAGAFQPTGSERFLPPQLRAAQAARAMEAGKGGSLQAISSAPLPAARKRSAGPLAAAASAPLEGDMVMTDSWDPLMVSTEYIRGQLAALGGGATPAAAAAALHAARCEVPMTPMNSLTTCQEASAAQPEPQQLPAVATGNLNASMDDETLLAHLKSAMGGQGAPEPQLLAAGDADKLLAEFMRQPASVSVAAPAAKDAPTPAAGDQGQAAPAGSGGSLSTPLRMHLSGKAQRVPRIPPPPPPNPDAAAGLTPQQSADQDVQVLASEPAKAAAAAAALVGGPGATASPGTSRLGKGAAASRPSRTPAKASVVPAGPAVGKAVAGASDHWRG